MEIERFILEMLLALGAGTAAGLLFLAIMRALGVGDDDAE